MNSGRRCGSTRATGVKKLVMDFERFLQPMSNLVPRTLVLRFLLAPNDLLDVREVLEKLGKLRNWKWVQLFDSDDRDISYTIHLAGLEQVVIDLATAEDDA